MDLVVQCYIQEVHRLYYQQRFTQHDMQLQTLQSAMATLLPNFSMPSSTPGVFTLRSPPLLPMFAPAPP